MSSVFPRYELSSKIICETKFTIAVYQPESPPYSLPEEFRSHYSARFDYTLGDPSYESFDNNLKLCIEAIIHHFLVHQTSAWTFDVISGPGIAEQLVPIAYVDLGEKTTIQGITGPVIVFLQNVDHEDLLAEMEALS